MLHIILLLRKGSIMYYLIYKITNTINNKIYIGKHQTDNKDDDYMGSGKILKRAIEKYGIDKFKKEILFECNSLEEMNVKEAEIVNDEFITRLDTYNVKLGGQGGFDYINTKTSWNGFKYLNKNKLNNNANQYLIAATKIKKDKLYAQDFSLKVQQGLEKYIKNGGKLNHWLDKKHTEETKAKIGKAKSIKQKGENNSNFGKCWIYNEELKENKSIKKEDLDQWLEKGWKKGRKMKF